MGKMEGKSGFFFLRSMVVIYNGLDDKGGLFIIIVKIVTNAPMHAVAGVGGIGTGIVSKKKY